MANRNTKKRAAKGLTAQGWGIVNAQGNLLYVTQAGRETVRQVKRASYAGAEFRTVKIDATLTVYTK